MGSEAQRTVGAGEARSLEPPSRFELETYGLRNRCSTAELRWRTLGRLLTQPTCEVGLLPEPLGHVETFECLSRERATSHQRRFVSLDPDAHFFFVVAIGMPNTGH